MDFRCGGSLFATTVVVACLVMLVTVGRTADVVQGTADFKGQAQPLVLRSVEVDGHPLSGISQVSLDLPSHPRITTFTFASNPFASNAPLRIRYQLDGYEQGWHEQTAWMRMIIRFIDANLRDVGEKEFTVSGESPGWTGSLNDSPWVRQKEAVTVPAGAVRFLVLISSAGPPEAVGLFAVRKLMVWPSIGNTNVIRMIPPVKPDDRKSSDEATEIRPAGWERNGIQPANARLMRYSSGSEVALAILDDNPHGHADWNTFRDQGIEVKPGDQLTLEWEEIYSIGMAGFVNASYSNLPSGLFRFRMEALNLMGIPTGRGISQLVVVPVAFWKTLWFWVAVGVGLTALATGGWRLTEWRRMKRQVQELQRSRDLEHERLRIAQNIHDDIGARVTEISLVSSSAQLKTNLPSEARAEFTAVSRLASELVQALHQTVWAVNPKDDHLDSLASFICQMANKMCGQAQLRCRLQVPDLSIDVPVDSLIRHNVIMAVKEAIHNVIKHSHASEIQVIIRLANQVLTVQVGDNGCGFDPKITARGNGLDNMEFRMRSLRGNFSVASQPGAGTKITFEFPLSANKKTASKK